MKLTDTDQEIIRKHFRENYEGTCEVCGSNSEEAREAKALYEKVLSQPMVECQSDIESFYAEMSDAVGGQIHNYYASDPELIRMIEKNLMKEE